MATAFGLVASPAAAQEPSADLQALHLPQAWATTTGEGVVVAVLDDEAPEDAADLVSEAAPGADARSVAVENPAEIAIAIDDAVDERASVIAVTLPDALADETVRRAVQAAADAGVTVVAPDPGSDVDLPDELPVVLVGGRGVTAGDVDTRTATAYVAATAALVAGQVTPSELAVLLDNTADGSDNTINAEAAVELAANMGAGGAALPPPEDRTGGLPPKLVGVIAFGLAGLAIGGTILLAGRKPKPRSS